MIDATTQKPLHVSTEGNAGPFIEVPVSQLADVCQILDQHKVRYSVEEDAISLDGAPETTVINLARGTDARAVQALLDSIP